MPHKTFFKKPKKKSPQRERRVWIDSCLKLWSKIIRHRDNYTCQWCASTNLPQGHHIVARGITQNCKTAWFSIDNGVTLCYKCHIIKLKSLPDEYIEWRDEWMSQNNKYTYQELRTMFSTKTKIRLEHLKIIYDDLKSVCVKEGIKLK